MKRFSRSFLLILGVVVLVALRGGGANRHPYRGIGIGGNRYRIRQGSLRSDGGTACEGNAAK